MSGFLARVLIAAVILVAALAVWLHNVDMLEPTLADLERRIR
jgi:hypothetical protein